MDPLQAVRAVLRALADIRDGPFYRLWVDLTYLVQTPLPTIDFRILRVADGDDAMAGVGVSMRRPDGADVGWSISVETNAGALHLTSSVEVTTDDGTLEVYSKSHTSHDPEDAVETIHAFARDVCNERSWASSTAG